MSISVLLVDDHALINEGLRRAFGTTEDLQVVAGPEIETRRAHSQDSPCRKSRLACPKRRLAVPEMTTHRGR